MNAYIKELDRYGDILTKEQMRIVCHISKRKAMYLLQSGLVPCINTGKKTHTYLIRKSDVKRYLKDRDEHPLRYQSISGNVPDVKNASRRNCQNLSDIVSERQMREYYGDKLRPYPDVLTVPQIKLITGYGENTIRGWIDKGELRHLDAVAGWRIPKAWMIDFLCSDYCNKISRKTSRHLKYIEEMTAAR